jgi:uncharacterized oligopeptide transporter (OPT) family protein
LSLLWVLFATVAAVIIARLVGCSNFWRSEAPVVSELLNVWLVLTLMMDGSLMGRSEGNVSTLLRHLCAGFSVAPPHSQQPL